MDRILAQAERWAARSFAHHCNALDGIYAGYFAAPDGHLWEAVYFVDQPIIIQSSD